MSLYGLILGISFVIGIYYFQKHEKKLNQKSRLIYQFLVIIIGIIGARIYFVLFNLDYFLNNKPEIINLRGGGLGIFGGIIAGVIFTMCFLKKKKVKFLNFTDQFIAIIPLCQSIGRWGNFFNHEIYSKNGHPIWLYESVLNLVLFLVLIKSKSQKTAKYLIGYGIIRLITEFFRYDVWIVNNIKIGQIISLIFIISGILIHYISSNKGIK